MIIYSFCHTVLSGWKDKFCQHLDKCKYAREVSISFILLCSTLLLTPSMLRKLFCSDNLKGSWHPIFHFFQMKRWVLHFSFHVAFLFRSAVTLLRPNRISHNAGSWICLFYRSNKTHIWERFSQEFSLHTPLASAFNVSYSEAFDRTK